MLRNPNFQIAGTASFPDNVYEVDKRTIRPIDADYAAVEVCLKRYADESKTEKIPLNPRLSFVLRNLPNDPAQLNPTLYQSELLIQHGDKIVDGTALKDFVII